MIKQAIVSGGTGFIGGFLVRELLKKNIQTIVLGRKKFEDIDSRKNDFFDNVNCHYINLNMDNILNLSDELKSNKIEILENCIFYNIAWGTAKNLSDLDIKGQLANVEWSLNAYNTAVKLGCTKFIHVGTMEEGFTRKYLDLDYTKDNKYNRHIIYSLAKIASKDCLKLNYDKKHNISLIFVNNSHVMGPLDNKDSFLQVTLGKLIKKEELIFSTGEQYFDCISVFDVARAYLLVGDKGLNGKEYWIGSGEARQLKEYVKIMYSLYPSGMKMNFGHFEYNDISLTKEDFSIENLITDTGFKPSNTFEDTVQNLAEHLNNGKVVEI
jgi:nucleoside-diphosphate-sugar epimerase